MSFGRSSTARNSVLSGFPPPALWLCPPWGVLKVNWDSTLQRYTRKAFGSFIFCNWNGFPICCRFVVFLGDDALFAEGQAVFHALLTAH